MHLQLFLTRSEISVAQLGVVIFVCHLTKQVDTMKLMEDLEANSVSLDSGLWVDCSQMSLRHADYVEFLIGNDLVTNCNRLILRSESASKACLLSYEIACHALSTSGPDPT